MPYKNIIAAILIVIIRLGSVKNQSFQATAHLYTGGLFTAAYIRGYVPYYVIGFSLTMIELLCFIFKV